MTARFLDAGRKVVGLGVSFLAATTLTNPKTVALNRNVLVDDCQAMKYFTYHFISYKRCGQRNKRCLS